MYKKILLAAAILLALLLPAMAFEAGEAETTADWLNFRSSPGMDGQILDAIPQGTRVEILEDLGDWCRIRWDGREGYVSANYLRQELASSSAPAEPAAESQSRIGILTGDGVRFRASPSLSAAIYGYFYKGDRVTVLSQEGDWVQVEAGGKIGYLYGQYVRIQEPLDAEARSSAATAILDTAKANLGVRYVYGGASPDSGFDCSGLVYYCFGENGYSMNRTASQQYSQGAFVEKSELQPGDLVFFSSADTRGVAHVGIYLGDGKFIHASSTSGKIVTSELSNSYFTRYYYGARRILI